MVCTTYSVTKQDFIYTSKRTKAYLVIVNQEPWNDEQIKEAFFTIRQFT
jgi:hypothetical protein